MAILWAGGEDVDFPTSIGGVSVGTAAGDFRAGYARCAIYPTAAGGSMKSAAFPGGAVTSCWMSFRGFWGGALAETQGLGLVLSSANKGILIGVDASGFVKLWKFDSIAPSLTQIAIEASASFGSGVLHKIDLQVTGWGASATVNVYNDGVLRITYTGDLTFSGAVASVDSAWARSGNIPMFLSEMIVSSTDTRALSLCTMAPNAAGTTSSWTGAYTDVNETTINDATAVNTNALTQDEQFNLIDLPAGTFTIQAVVVAARAETTGGATATKVALGINSAGSIDAGTLRTLTTSYATYLRLMTVNPLTGIAWLQAVMNGLQVNLRSGS